MNIDLILAFIFIIISILTLFKLKITQTWYDFFWFCDLAPFVLAVAYLIDNIQLIKSMLNIGLLLQIITLILLLYGFIFKKDVVGTKEANSRGKFYVFTEVLLHVTLIIALIFSINSSPNELSLIYSFIFLFLMFVLTLLFTDKKFNINMIEGIGTPGNGNLMIKLPLHKQLWVVYAMGLVLISYFLQILIFNFLN